MERLAKPRVACECRRHELNPVEDALPKSGGRRLEPLVVNYVSCMSACRGVASQPRVVLECPRHEFDSKGGSYAYCEARRAAQFFVNHRSWEVRDVEIALGNTVKSDYLFCAVCRV